MEQCLAKKTLMDPTTGKEALSPKTLSGMRGVLESFQRTRGRVYMRDVTGTDLVGYFSMLRTQANLDPKAPDYTERLRQRNVTVKNHYATRSVPTSIKASGGPWVWQIRVRGVFLGWPGRAPGHHTRGTLRTVQDGTRGREVSLGSSHRKEGVKPLFTLGQVVATPVRWPRLKRRASSRGSFLLAMSRVIGRKLLQKTSRKTSFRFITTSGS